MDVGDVAGLVGAASGLTALGWNIVEALRRRAAEIYPPELRGLLLQVVEVCDEVLREPRDYDWTAANVRPLEKSLQQVRVTMKDSKWSPIGGILANLTSQLGIVHVFSDTTVLNHSGAELARMVQQQAAGADSARKGALGLLHSMPSAR